jgi:D-erythronate 2-dehydrogenase
LGFQAIPLVHAVKDSGTVACFGSDGGSVNISILGSAGFLGRKIAANLAKNGTMGNKPVTGLTLFDLDETPKPTAAFPIIAVAGNLVNLPVVAIPPDTDVIFHLAAVVSAQAEADYELGRQVNLRGTDAVIDGCRRLVDAGREPPRVVFTSSVASFSGGQDAQLQDDSRQIPANTYGAQKAAAELILADASRRGFLDLVALRLPTVIVRPGRPNRAASSFLSAIIREPLLGLPADLPMPDAFTAWVCSPRRAVDWLQHAGAMDTSLMGLDRSVNPPGISTTIAHLLQALEEVKPGASALVQRTENKDIANILGLWPAAFEAIRARTLGFATHEPLIEVIQAFVEDDLAATRAERGMF